MDAGIVGEFRMKGGGHGSSLPDSDGIGAFRSEDLDAFADLRNLGSADEDHFQRGISEQTLANRAVDLASIGVAADPNVESAESGLGRILDFGREQNGSSAGAERGFGPNELLELFETGIAQKLEECAGFATRDHEAIDFVELLGLSDEHNFGS